MLVLNVRNVHEALPVALDKLQQLGVDRESRNGAVKMFPCPVSTVYQLPTERVIFWPERDANPFFHLMESLWMLGGRNDVEFVARYVKTMQQFSDNGKTFHGAYGHRWRVHFGFDQLDAIIKVLRKNPDDRRCVLQMWDAQVDLARAGKDFPCNTMAVFQIDGNGQLAMTVFNRSNDIVWGAYGANAVHFSMLQEYVASCVGARVGPYTQVSVNLHAYLPTLEQVKSLAAHAPDPYGSRPLNPYREGEVGVYPLISSPMHKWNEDLVMFLENPKAMALRDPFFRRVAVPMAAAHQAYKTLPGETRYHAALEILERCEATDWRRAAREWLERRLAKLRSKHDDGVKYDS